ASNRNRSRLFKIRDAGVIRSDSRERLLHTNVIVSRSQPRKTVFSLRIGLRTWALLQSPASIGVSQHHSRDSSVRYCCANGTPNSAADRCPEAQGKRYLLDRLRRTDLHRCACSEGNISVALSANGISVGPKIFEHGHTLPIGFGTELKYGGTRP